MLDPRAHPDLHAWLTQPAKAMWCDGRPFDGSTTARIEVRDPATTVVVATVPRGSAADVDHIVGASSSALAGGVWQGLAPALRERTLLRLSDLVETHATSLQHLIVVENGKLL